MPSKPAKPKSGSALDDLLSILDLEPLEENLFRGRSPQQGWQRVFGGQVLGQALVAAVRTVPADRSPTRCTPTSCCRAIRRGRSSTTSSACATAAASRPGASRPSSMAGAMFVMSVSFHIAEPGLDHQNAMPKVPPPEDLPSEQQLKASCWPSCPRT